MLWNVEWDGWNINVKRVRNVDIVFLRIYFDVEIFIVYKSQDRVIAHDFKSSADNCALCSRIVQCYTARVARGATNNDGGKAAACADGLKLKWIMSNNGCSVRKDRCMNDFTLELERVLWAIARAPRWDTVVLGCEALQRMREMINQNENEMRVLHQGDAVCARMK